MMTTIIMMRRIMIPINTLLLLSLSLSLFMLLSIRTEIPLYTTSAFISTTPISSSALLRIPIFSTTIDCFTRQQQQQQQQRNDRVITIGTTPSTRKRRVSSSSLLLHGQSNNNNYLSKLVTGATVDERFDITVYPGPIRGIGIVVPPPSSTTTSSSSSFISYEEQLEYEVSVVSSIRSNTRIASIPAQNVLIVSNYRKENYDILLQKLLQQQKEQQQQQQVGSSSLGSSSPSPSSSTLLSWKDVSMWDRDLAILLWNEYLQVIQEMKSTTTTSTSNSDDNNKNKQRNKQSPLTGYIQYLCQQDDFSIQSMMDQYTSSSSSSSSYRRNNNIIPLKDIINIDTYIPPTTAPHTLRQWTNEQLQLLQSTYIGQKLIQQLQLQNYIWEMKYNSIKLDTSCNKYKNIRMSYEQFVWAMEVVHSRAFCGLPILNTSFNSSSSSSSTSNLVSVLQSALPGIVLPIFAAMIGYIYAISTIYPNEIILMILAMIGAIPLLISLFQTFFSTVVDVLPNKMQYKNVDQAAVLLPIIDCANHHDDTIQDTNIVYNPIQHTFEWMIGPKSFIPTPIQPMQQQQQQRQPFANAIPTTTITSDDLIPKLSYQVCISYGGSKQMNNNNNKSRRSDNEWLLNYGFLPGININADIDNDDAYRYFLSQMYLQRNDNTMK